jgi:hypothetical protein
MRRTVRVLGTALVVLIGLYLVGRALVEVVAVDPGDPASYRDDWGGPTYAGVLLVHAGPGLLVVALAVWMLVRRRRDRSR